MALSNYLEPWSQPSYVVSLDLGQAHDFAAGCVLEEPVWIRDADQLERFSLPRDTGTGWVSPAGLHSRRVAELRVANRCEPRHLGGRPPRPPLTLRDLWRWPLRTGYPKIVDDVAALLAAPPLGDRPTVLVLDRTGVGSPVSDLFQDRGLWPVGITLTGGHEPNYDRLTGAWNCPKRDAVLAAVAALQSHRLPMAAGEWTSTLVDELRNFHMKINLKTGTDSYEAWRESVHDDLTLAVCLGVWYREHMLSHVESDLAERWNAPAASPAGRRRRGPEI